MLLARFVIGFSVIQRSDAVFSVAQCVAMLRGLVVRVCKMFNSCYPVKLLNWFVCSSTIWDREADTGRDKCGLIHHARMLNEGNILPSTHETVNRLIRLTGSSRFAEYSTHALSSAVSVVFALNIGKAARTG